MQDEQLTEHLSVRVSRRLLEELVEEAKRRGEQPTATARRLIDEGLRMQRYPGIVFRDRAAGRRASIAGSRLDVWQVIETVRQSNGDVEAAADYFRIRPDQVRAAVAYAADYPDEIDARIRNNQEVAARAREASERQRAVIGR